MPHRNCLVVGENAIERLFMRTAANIFGFADVLEAEHLEEARPHLQNDTVNLLLLSDRVGQEDGIAFTRSLRWNNEGVDPTIPVMILSHDSSREHSQAARDAGVDELVEAPFTSQRLVQLIDRTLNQMRPFVHADGYIGPCRRRWKLPVAGERRLEAAPA